MSRIVAVSNRVAAPGAAGSPGGLGVALQSALAGAEALWFGWSGRRAPSFSGTVEMREQGALRVAQLDLDDQDFESYYNGFANAMLWPVFHARTDLAAYDRAFGAGYDRVNARFAEALVPLLRPDDLIWVHDYHLIPLGRELRRLGVKQPIGFFLHIPWPAPQQFATIPQHRELVEALFAYDLVGLQTEEDVCALTTYAEAEFGGHLTAGRLLAEGRSVCVGAFPVGLDVEPFLELAASAAADRSWERMSAHGAFRSLVVGVDRLDYSKGLPERLLGFERYLSDHPEMARKVIYLQIAPSSRAGVDAYQALRADVLALAGRINATFADMDHAPVLCVNRGFDRAELAGVYRAARVGLVTPLRDGMNLVAKEYVGAQDPRDPGVLVLSRFAGAARQMKDAILVNPYCRDEMADALDQALSMGLSERRRRWESLMAGVVQSDVRAWRDDFLAALRGSRRRVAPANAAVSWPVLLGQAIEVPISEAPSPALRARALGSAALEPGWRSSARG